MAHDREWIQASEKGISGGIFTIIRRRMFADNKFSERPYFFYIN